MRTNCALESYNAAIGRRFPKRGNFFRFISLLACEELVKRVEMYAAVAGHIKKKRRRINNKDSLIEETTALLIADEITINQFLDRLINEYFCQPNSLEWDDESGDKNEIETNDGFEKSSTNMNTVTPNETEVNFCVFCFSKVSDTLFLPCRHLKSCQKCYSDFRSKTKPPYRCPLCRQEIKNTIVVI